MSSDDRLNAHPEEFDAPTTGHEYDGIREYDNPLPGWWVWGFWATIAFSLAYFVHYELTGNGETMLATYDREVAAFREAEALREMGSEVTEESLAKLMADAPMMKDAQLIYQKRCLTCHADRGQGGIGPNLTDRHWIHGQGTLMDIHQVVSEGVLSKGMPNWNRQLTPMELRKVVCYIGTLRNTRVPGKAPEGVEVTDKAPLGVGG